MKILIATDGSEYSEAAVREVCEMISITVDTEIRVISVIEPVAPTAPFGVSDEYYVQAREALTKAAGVAVEDSFELLTACVGDRTDKLDKITISGRPSEAILDAAENWAADLLVVGSHGRGFWGRMLLGSVSSAVVKHAGCSVLVVRK